MQVIDPVSRMTIDSEQAAGLEVWEGQTYYFCSTSCRGNSMQLLSVTPTRPANLRETRIAAERSGSAIEALWQANAVRLATADIGGRACD